MGGTEKGDLGFRGWCLVTEQETLSDLNKAGRSLRAGLQAWLGLEAEVRSSGLSLFPFLHPPFSWASFVSEALSMWWPAARGEPSLPSNLGGGEWGEERLPLLPGG